MAIIGWILVVFFILYFGIQLVMIFFLLVDKEEKIIFTESLPRVSILIAARNEEYNILACLQSLSQLDYPIDKLEILLGDDCSTDNTSSIISGFIKDKPQFKLISITKNLGLARGKANVLAQLANMAQGDYFLITDADIVVQPQWVKTLVGTCESDCGTVSGVTIINEKGIFAGFQAIEWIFAFGFMRVMQNRSAPVSAVGNNMLVRRDAYFSTGGYENLPFSITEDFQLFIETLKKGWKFKNLLQGNGLVYTQPKHNLKELLIQRKRWMTGAFQLPVWVITILGIQSAFLAFFVPTLFVSREVAFLLLAGKIVMDFIYAYLILSKIRQLDKLRELVFYELISPFISTIQFVYFLLPGDVEWKGRKYSKK